MRGPAPPRCVILDQVDAPDLASDYCEIQHEGEGGRCRELCAYAGLAGKPRDVEAPRPERQGSACGKLVPLLYGDDQPCALAASHTGACMSGPRVAIGCVLVAHHAPERGEGQTRCVRCGALPGNPCDPAKHDARLDARAAVALPDARTSTLLRAAAVTIEAFGDAYRQEGMSEPAAAASVVAAELRARAARLETAADYTAPKGAPSPFNAGRLSVLREIGEVRS